MPIRARIKGDGSVEYYDTVSDSVVDPTAALSGNAEVVARKNEATIRDRMRTALAVNDTYIARTSPTNAQTVAQVKALSRQNNAIIRLLLRQLDSVNNT